MWPAIGQETVTVVKRTLGPDKDPAGVPVKHISTFAVQGCSFQPLSTAEILGNEDMTVDMRRYIGPVINGLSTTDAMIAYGLTYEVSGSPSIVPSMFGPAHHMEVLVRLAAG